ncbi:hypothetical protein GCM10017706_28790 [Lactococcus lactis subsp. hordniae]
MKKNAPIIYNEYSRYKDEIIQGTVEKVDARAVYVNLGRVDALLTKKDQIPQENFHVGDRVKVYVTDVVLTPKGTRVFISRTAPDMLKRMFEKEIPEVFDGTVEIKSIARDAGDRAKVIVQSHDENVMQLVQWLGLKVHVFKESFANLRVKKWISLNGQKIKQHLLLML